MTEQQASTTKREFPLARLWKRVSPSIMPVLAVLTALMITVPFMIVTGGRGDIGRGLSISGTAYSALIEGSLGIVINDMASPDDLNLIQTLANAEADGLSQRDLRGLAGDLGDVDEIGLDVLRRYTDVMALFPDMSDDDLDALGGRIASMLAVGELRLEMMRPLLAALAERERDEVSALAERYAAMTELSAADRAELEAVIPAAKDYNDEDLLQSMSVLNKEGIVRLRRMVESLDLLKEKGIALTSQTAQDLAAMAEIGTVNIRDMLGTIARLDASGVSDTAALLYQVRLTNDLYAAGLLTENDVVTAINTQLETAARENLVVRRPSSVERLLVARGHTESVGLLYNLNNTPDDTSDDKPEIVFFRLGGSALLFFPANLEVMIVRSIPFVIAGLAVALAFKAGLFNIGAEGQLYAGGVLAVTVGFAPPFQGLPPVIHLPLVIVAGILGGILWGAIPGILKAFTGAHEVINTIMLNLIAVRLVDWLIKSTNPVILLDTTASVSRTPYIAEGARLPRFNTIPSEWFVIAGLVTLAWGLWARRDSLRANWRLAVRPVINGLIVMVGGFFLSWLTVRNELHVGLLLMIAALWFTNWLLDRTTIGFELRTVGSNPDAARYAGMNVKLNIVLAMALSGALAGMAGMNEISGKQFNMAPEFFAGLGFDAIAVALLARTNPRNMVTAGFLWGALLSGAGLMQIRAEISIDLVKIIQALIIMFIAADAIIRYLWRIPRATTEEKTAQIFSKGWSG